MTSGTETPPEADVERDERPTLPALDRWTGAVIASCALVVVGSIGPWVDAGFITVGGLKTDGRITLAAGIIALALVMPRPLHRSPGILAATVLLGVSSWFVARVFAIANGGNELFSVNLGWGVAATAVGSAVLGGLVIFQFTDRNRLIAGGVALAIAIACAVWGASVGGDGDLPANAKSSFEMPDFPEIEPIPEIPEIEYPEEPEAAPVDVPEEPTSEDDRLECGVDLITGDNVSCQFARSVARQYRGALADGESDPIDLNVYSEAVGSDIAMSCSLQDGESVMCTGGNEAVISFDP